MRVESKVMGSIGKFDKDIDRKPSEAKSVAEERGEYIVTRWTGPAELTITAHETLGYVVYIAEEPGGYFEPFSENSDYQTAYDDAIYFLRKLKENGYDVEALVDSKETESMKVVE